MPTGCTASARVLSFSYGKGYCHFPLDGESTATIHFLMDSGSVPGMTEEIINPHINTIKSYLFLAYFFLLIISHTKSMRQYKSFSEPL